MSSGYQLPVQPELSCGRETQGFLTPAHDLTPQVMSVPPRRVLPIVFLPGIMGSNLRMNAERQRRLGKDDNRAWRPDDSMFALGFRNANAATRQLQLDPATTEVDTYDPVNNPTGNPNVSADQRHDNVKVAFDYSPLDIQINTPLLMDDPPKAAQRRTKEQKARERGWGEVFFDSYRQLLELCELRLNTAFENGQLSYWWRRNVAEAKPEQWQIHPQFRLSPLDKTNFKQAATSCWFPVHAMGYNWLESNGKSGEKIASRITALIGRYQQLGYQCEKVIVVTHSMGGLVARALIHPDMGNLKDKVLGVVHGVMPATGAGAAFRRMRCGFEGSGITPKVLGDQGDRVTAVLANAQGGLELLPAEAYGNEWLHIVQGERTLKSLPQKGDPYEEIYKVRGKWYGLLREEWINPAGLTDRGVARTTRLLDDVKAFHRAISNTYHDHSYAHYGADPERRSWHHVVWEIDPTSTVPDIEAATIAGDDRRGTLTLHASGAHTPLGRGTTKPGVTTKPDVRVKLRNGVDPGDQTVPVHSADHQLRSGKFKAVFRQTGYEHQDSYKDERALHSTLYCLASIVQTMTWSAG